MQVELLLTSIRQQTNGHRSDIKHNRNKPVVEHFNKLDHRLENLRLVVIKKVKEREVEEQKNYFQIQLHQVPLSIISIFINLSLIYDFFFSSSHGFMFACHFLMLVFFFKLL